MLYQAVARRDAGPRDRAEELAAATEGETKSPDGLLLRQSVCRLEAQPTPLSPSQEVWENPPRKVTEN